MEAKGKAGSPFGSGDSFLMAPVSLSLLRVRARQREFEA